MAQLEGIAVAVSRNAMPSNSDNSELANRLAMQAAALEADNMDPLGLGRIDTQGLSLVRAPSWRGRLRRVRLPSGRLLMTAAATPGRRRVTQGV